MNGLFLGVNGKYDQKKETLYRKQPRPLQSRSIIGYLDEEMTPPARWISSRTGGELKDV